MTELGYVISFPDEDWIKGLEGRGYTAGVGEPINLFYPELLRIFPHAKVVLTTRPVEDWVKSMKKAIIEPRPYLERPPISWLFGLFGITKAKNSLAQVWCCCLIDGSFLVLQK